MIISTTERAELNPLRYVYNEFIRADDMQDLAAVHHWMHLNAREKSVFTWDGSEELWFTTSPTYTTVNGDPNFRDLDTFHFAITPRRYEVGELAAGRSSGLRNYIVCTVVDSECSSNWLIQNQLYQYDPGATNDTTVTPITEIQCNGGARRKAYFYDLVSTYDPVILQARPQLRSPFSVQCDLHSVSVSLAEILPGCALGDARLAGGNFGIGCFQEAAAITEWEADDTDLFANGAGGATEPIYRGVIAAGFPPVANFNGGQNLLARPTYPNTFGGFIFSACVRVDNTGGAIAGCLFEIDDGTNQGLIVEFVAGQIRVTMTNTTATPHTIGAVAYPNDFLFHDITVYYDGSATMRLFVDGAQIGSVAATGVPRSPGTVNMRLGNNNALSNGLACDVYGPEYVAPAITPAVLWLVSRASVIGQSTFPITDC